MRMGGRGIIWQWSAVFFLEQGLGLSSLEEEQQCAWELWRYDCCQTDLGRQDVLRCCHDFPFWQ